MKGSGYPVGSRGGKKARHEQSKIARRQKKAARRTALAAPLPRKDAR